jgi:hypothetical protein
MRSLNARRGLSSACVEGENRLEAPGASGQQVYCTLLLPKGVEAVPVAATPSARCELGRRGAEVTLPRRCLWC